MDQDSYGPGVHAAPSSTAARLHGGHDPAGLYHPSYERDSCGFGLIANLDDEPSHWLVKTAISSLNRLTHRGAVAADGKTGDGCGLLLKKPEKFLRAIAADAGFELGLRFASGIAFLSRYEDAAERARAALGAQLKREGLSVAGWRVVPTDPAACGAQALQTLPRLEQVFVNCADDVDEPTFNRRLFLARRRTEKQLEQKDPVFYMPSLSASTIVYKGMVMPEHLTEFYPDLGDPRLESSVAVFHQRFSTNTLPQWRLAHPYRFLAHNGEINTISGNRNWAVARGAVFRSPVLPDLSDIQPLVSLSGSDSQTLDNMLEVLLMGGLDVLHAMRLLIPPAWQTVDTLDPDLRAFYEFYSTHMEPWDGPAGIVLCDGRYAACTLDRNGLRPARWVITRDRHLTVASEIGVWDYRPEDVLRKGKLGPGEMLALDLQTGELLDSKRVDQVLKARHPYKSWLKKGVRYLESDLIDARLAAEPMDGDTLGLYMKMYNVTAEERDEIIRVLAEDESEAVSSMGDDTPMPVLSHKIRSLYDYFRQQFAQVTNPPIDPLRESIVMSLQTQIGPERNVFAPAPEHAQQIVLNSPILSQRKLRQILGHKDMGVTHEFIDLQHPVEEELGHAIARICDQAEAAVRAGKLVLLLSDRYLVRGKVPTHVLLATGAVHHRLVRAGLRCRCNLLIETGTARDPHHFACLIGYGATAVYPYMAYQTLFDMMRNGSVSMSAESRAELGRSYRRGIRKGLFKIMSKMGISTIGSYRGSQLFEIVGLHDEVVDLCFPGTVSRIQGARLSDLESDQRTLAERAWDPLAPIQQGGLIKYVHGGEYHMYNPDVVATLQSAVMTGDYQQYKEFARLVNERPAACLRDLFALIPGTVPIPLAEVEPVEEILKRFDSAGMSLGALSPEAHEALAIAMNRLGARSNSGEGGEDPARYGTERNSKIKQVASARFGVTPEYLISAEVLQIKIAQGAKPGEGGQLPGHKVNEMIARLRFARAGVGLISPPPHHDIYSIEDLAQLIFDLKNANPKAAISVKLVSEVGVGTVAAGVAKAHADVVLISGYDGGTGASPQTSIKHAGIPWELGLAETHQTLVLNNLRSRIVVEADGQMKTGRDVIVAALLGAEEFGFATAPLVSLGCIMMRVCHLNTCPVGVATQDPVLRAKFTGDPEHAANFMRFIAQEVRELMAQLGFRKLTDMVGRTDMLEARKAVDHWKAKGLDFSKILYQPPVGPEVGRFCTETQDHGLEKSLDLTQLLDICKPAIERGEKVKATLSIRNVNRVVGTILGHEITKKHWYGLPEDTVHLKFNGSAGQSLGAFIPKGVTLELEGDANDYVGKGMSGGKIIIYPPAGSTFNAEENIIAGNVTLYGATAGEVFLRGMAGERFAVRNSGVDTVVEGVGDHGCEYMTGGRVVILGLTGRNFAAGMSGGVAYVLDEAGDFATRCNTQMVALEKVEDKADIDGLYALIKKHADYTKSQKAFKVLALWEETLPKFVKVMPKDYKRVLQALKKAEADGLTGDDAANAAFEANARDVARVGGG